MGNAFFLLYYVNARLFTVKVWIEKSDIKYQKVRHFKYLAISFHHWNIWNGQWSSGFAFHGSTFLFFKQILNSLSFPNSYNAIAGRIASGACGDEGSDDDFDADDQQRGEIFSCPELLHNLDTLIQETEQQILKVSVNCMIC